jgi:uncharacterized protein (DUF302 family)
MSKLITQITVQLVTVESSRPISEVTARLDEEINKAGSPEALRLLLGGKSRDEIVTIVNKTLGDRDFLYVCKTVITFSMATSQCCLLFSHFSTLPHGRWVNNYFGIDTSPSGFVYTYGNPIFAAGIMKHYLCAGLNLPLRLFVTEKGDRSGTRIIYHLPSSLVVLGDNIELKAIAEELDARVERLVNRVLTT